MPASQSPSTDVPTRPRRRWFQFRLRTLLVGVLLLSACLSGYVWLRQRARSQAKAVATLREMGVSVGYEYDEWAYNRTLFFNWSDWNFGGDLLVRDFFENAVAVNASEYRKYMIGDPIPISDPRKFWMSVQELPALRGLTVASDQVTPADLRTLENHSKLEWLFLVSAEVTDEHLQEIGRLQSVSHLAVGADWWNGRQAKLSYAGIDQIAALPNLMYLDLSGTSLDDRAAKSLARAQTLKVLYLIETEISDEGLLHLAPLKNLATINVSGSLVTKAGSDAFQAAMPNCEVQNFVPKE
jgi:hypothetical protein